MDKPKLTRTMQYSDFSIDLVLKQMAEIFNKKSTPTRICSVMLEATEIIQQLMRSPVLEPNAPLTLEELREMDGEPVWVTSVNNWRGRSWTLVDTKYEICREVHGGLAVFENYGKTWLAYRRKPEEGTT